MGIHPLLWTSVEVWALLFFVALLFSRRGHSLSSFLGKRTRAYRDEWADFFYFLHATGIHPTPPPSPEMYAPQACRIIDWLLTYGFAFAIAACTAGYLGWELCRLIHWLWA